MVGVEEVFVLVVVLLDFDEVDAQDDTVEQPFET